MSTTYEERQAEEVARRRAVYERQDKLEHDFFAVTVPAVLAELNKLEPDAKWALEGPFPGEAPDYKRGYVQNPAGERLSFSFDKYKNKLSVHGRYGERPDGRVWIPRDYVRRDENLEDPNPHMSATKTPAQLAKDVAKRLLPDYRVLLAKYRESVAETNAYLDKTAALATELVAAAGGPGVLKSHGREEKGASERTFSLYDVGGVSYGTVRVSGSSVRFDQLSVSPEFAKKFMALLNEGGK